MNRTPHRHQSLWHRLKLGRLLYLSVYRPLGYLKTIRARGWWAHLRYTRGQRQMRAAARRCPPAPSAQLPPPSLPAKVTYLTGSAYWWETIWCGTSLLTHCPHGLPLEIVDDGSLTPAQIRHLRRVFPKCAFVSAASVETILRDRLPPEKYPLIWFYRRTKPIFRKLTDVFGRDDNWRLLLDSDMLFFQRPDLLVDWLGQPNRPTYMVDVHNAYGYSPELMARLAGGPIPDLVNIGIFGFAGSLVNWDRVENWLRELTETEGLKYNLCQAVSAMHLANRECLILPPADYLLLPTRAQSLQPTQVLQHYVAESKTWYFEDAWRIVAQQVLHR